jgi:transposase
MTCGPGAPGTPPTDLAGGLASLRPRPGSMIRYHTLLSLRERGRRVAFPDGQVQRLDALIVPLMTARAPGLLALYGVGPDTAAKLLIAAGDHPERLRSEAAWAHLCAAAPIPASSGKGHPPPAQPRRRPAGQPRPVPDRSP